MKKVSELKRDFETIKTISANTKDVFSEIEQKLAALNKI